VHPTCFGTILPPSGRRKKRQFLKRITIENHKKLAK